MGSFRWVYIRKSTEILGCIRETVLRVKKSPRRESTYQIARALGVESSARLVFGGNCIRAGVLPPEEGIKIAEELGASFSAPDLEMDLTEVPEDKLLDAVNAHAMDVRFVRFSFLFRVVCYYGPSVLSFCFLSFSRLFCFLGPCKNNSRAGVLISRRRSRS